MRRIDCINKINTYAARFVLEVQGFNALGHYHINIHAENFLIPVLNQVFGLNLENLNATQKKNFPAIDLADFTNRIAFQVTATSSESKIRSTLEIFSKKQLDQHFDRIYFYIITEKRESYQQEKLITLLPDGYDFNASDHIIDKDSIMQLIDGISATPQLEALAKIYEHEFSDIQIQERRKEFEGGYLNTESEEIYPNMLEVCFPDKFYIADLNIDELAIIEEVNDILVKGGKKRVKKIRPEKLVKHFLHKNEFFSKDFLLHEKSVFTFRDLNDPKEPLRSIIDIGTITPQECGSYYESNEANSRVFKDLLRRMLIELCRGKGMQWFAEKKVIRFANNQKAPNKKQIKWKGKKEATKTVIFEVINKKEQHIICYRNLAFRPSFEHFGSKWFLVINPTWSFTDPNGFKTSRFESGYMSGIKRLENNGSIYNYFRFFSYYLTYTDLFSTDYLYLKIQPAFTITMQPGLDEKAWKPAKLPEPAAGEIEGLLEKDSELDKLFLE